MSIRYAKDKPLLFNVHVKLCKEHSSRGVANRARPHGRSPNAAAGKVRISSSNRGQAAAPDRTKERMLIYRLYLGLMRTITDDYGAEFAPRSDSLAYRTIGIYIFLRTVMCSPVRASQIAHALKLPRVSVVRRLEELIKHGYVERVGNAYPRHGQGEHARPAEETATANRHGR